MSATNPAPADPYPRTRVTGAFERRVAARLDPLLTGDQPVLVAASGGPDSTATLVAVTRLVGSARVTAAHFDHRLRTPREAAQELDCVRRVAATLGTALITGRARRRPLDRSEAEAREARYRWLASACRRTGVGAVITGHNLDDQAETVLLRLVRGTGPGGAAGMAADSGWPVRVPGSAKLRVLRPLLGVTRRDVERYLDALGLEAVSDASNERADYARNRVRLQVMPVLRDLNPRAAEQMARFAELQRADDQALLAWARREFERIAESSEGRVAMDRRALRELPPAVAARCLRLAAESVGLRLDGAHIDAMLDIARRSGRRIALDGGEARTRPSVLEVVRARDPRQG